MLKKDYTIDGRNLHVEMHVEPYHDEDGSCDSADIFATCRVGNDGEPREIIFQVTPDVCAPELADPDGTLALGEKAGIEDAVYQLFLDLGGDEQDIEDDFSNLWEVMDDMLSEVIEDAQAMRDECFGEASGEQHGAIEYPNPALEPRIFWKEGDTQNAIELRRSDFDSAFEELEAAAYMLDCGIDDVCVCSAGEKSAYGVSLKTDMFQAFHGLAS
jgi:hypothetical protein